MSGGITRRALAAGLLGRARRPAVAFHYDAVFTEREARWYSRFELLVTGAILAPGQAAVLRAKGSRLAAYEWSSAFYPGDWVSAGEAWQSRVRPDWALTEAPVSGGAAEGGKAAVWYDFANEHLVAARADYLAGELSRSGYDGFFFDTLGFEQLPAAAQQAFARRHPGADYNRCQGQFLAALRRRMPAGTLIFTNQGYRHAAEFLPHADLDLTESYFTFLSGSRTRMRPWDDAGKPWEAIRTPMVELVLAAQRQFPDVRFVHVNYAAAPAEGAAVYSYAAAKLFGHESYLIVPGDSASEEHDVYSADLGKPLTAGYEEDAAAGAVWRRYEFGAVAIHAGARPFVIPGTRYTLTAPGRGYVFRQGLSGGL